jgi:hypothetical protein
MPKSRGERPRVDRLLLVPALAGEMELPEVSPLRRMSVRPDRVPDAPPPYAEAGGVYRYVLLTRWAYLFLNLAVMASFTLTRVSMLIFPHAL